MEHRIPKVIHYCWFGGAPLPELAIKCMESWKKYCPEYEIRRWDESNFDVGSCKYVREAYAARKWAFVSDYARFHILHTHGGVYLDTDVELIRPLGEILEQGSFMASESPRCDVATGLGIAACPGLVLYKEIIEDYERSDFIREDGTCDLTTVVNRVTRILERHGLERRDVMQRVAGVTVYPREYFCPLDFRTKRLHCTEHTYAIHHYDSSWWTREQKRAGKLAVVLRRVLPEKAAKRTAKGLAVLSLHGVSGLREEFRRSREKRMEKRG